jgi:acetylornithine deacetylase/succinyl-diaminopimelate desuccinylase-like protein
VQNTTLSPAELEEALRHLRRAIQTETINPPGNEARLAAYVQSVLDAEGIETRLLEPAPGRAAVIARLRGSGAKPPVLLTAHLDVVGVEPSEWTVDPFGGIVKDGYVYGRGAIDDKGMLAAAMMAVQLFKRRVADQRTAFDRDVILAATADEETGGALGIGWILERHPELMRAEYAINEGGRIRVVNGKPLYAAIQTAEKVNNVVSVTASGPAGHASIPLEGNAVARLARAVSAIAAHREPVTLIPTTQGFFEGLARVWPDAEIARAMSSLASGIPGQVARGAGILSRVPLFDAVVRTGISPTMLSAGIRHNVIPAAANATLSIRTLPGQPIEGVVERLRAIVNDSGVEITVTDAGLDAPASRADSPMFAAISEAIAQLDPGLVTVPYMSTGATESARLRAWGVETYGLLPFPLDENDERRMHGADERVPVEAFAFGIRLLLNVLYRVQGLPPAD